MSSGAMERSLVELIEFEFPKELARFNKDLLPSDLLLKEDREFLEAVGLPQWVLVNLTYNRTCDDFVAIARLKCRKLRRELRSDNRVVIANGYGTAICLSGESGKVYSVSLERSLPDSVVNSSLQQHVACLALIRRHFRTVEHSPHDWEHCEESAVRFLRSAREVDPDVLNAETSYWEEWIVDAGYGEPVNWR